MGIPLLYIRLFIIGLALENCLKMVLCSWPVEWLKASFPLQSRKQSITKVKNFGIPHLDGKIMGFADYNGDQYSDIFLYNAPKSTKSNGQIYVFLWSPKTKEFIKGPFTTFNKTAVMFITEDWNGDGYMDILVVTERNDITKTGYGFTILAQCPETNQLVDIWESPEDSLSTVQFLAVDINHDGHLDLLGERSISNNIPYERFVWVNLGENKHNISSNIASVSFELLPWALLGEWVEIEDPKINYAQIASRHSSAFVDMDGDCRADIVLEVNYSNESSSKRALEIWLNQVHNGIAKYKVHRQLENDNSSNYSPIILPSGSGHIGFSDFNGDGSIDLLIPVCIYDNKKQCVSNSRIVFVPNVQEGSICSTKDELNFKAKGQHDEIPKCRLSNKLCTSSQFSLHSFTSEDDNAILQDISSEEKSTIPRSFLSFWFGNNNINSRSNAFFQGFTVSALFETINLSSENIHDDKRSKGQTENNHLLQSSMASHVASFFSFFPTKRHLQALELQWATDEFSPTVLNIGDQDLDGYPDVLAIVVLPDGSRQARVLKNLAANSEKSRYIAPAQMGLAFQNSSSENNGKINPHIIVNSYVSSGYTGKFLTILNNIHHWFSRFFIDSERFINKGSIYRHFELLDNDAATNNMDFVEQATFFDFYDDGLLDIIYISSPNEHGKRNVSCAISQSDGSALFMKITILSSSNISPYCRGKCTGNTSHGPTVKITITDLNGIKTPRTATQFPQSTNGVIQQPYLLFGLGKTNNYIEELFVGIPAMSKVTESSRKESSSLLKFDFSGGRDTGNSEYSNIWMGLIPNTHVIAQLYPINNPRNWSLVLSVSPTKTFTRIITVTVLALVIIGIIIGILDRREKVEDMKEHQGFKNHFISA